MFITAARYLYVTVLLYQESKPLDVIDYKIPWYSCYPSPYGSATETSDYDVGLVGPKSWELMANFNYKFSDQFRKSSDEVFDTNIYAYNFGYAMPAKFVGMQI